MDVYGERAVFDLIRTALGEDLDGQDPQSDVTVRTLVEPGRLLEATITAKASGVMCGLPTIDLVWELLGGGVKTHYAVMDGTQVAAGTVVYRCVGPAATILVGERTGLNIAQRLSGTASLTRRYVDLIRGTAAKVYDTRKTTPGLRTLQKHAVKCGGGENHRFGLYDQVLIKENHIALMPGPSSGPAEAVRRCRQALGPQMIIEVEIERLIDLDPVIQAGASIVLLDNMGPDLLREAVAIRAGRPVHLEASGGITERTIRAVAETGVDRISVGALTHSAGCLDLSMRCVAAT